MPTSTGPDRSSVIDVRGCEVASRTDVGSVRAQNQDACAALERPDGARLLIVADGMGGHRGGETASRLAVETLAAAFEAATRGANSPFSAGWLAETIQRANRDVHAAAEAGPGLRGMGTTLVSVLVDTDGRAFVGHVGDSRAYLLRGETLERVTEDHSVVAEMQRRGMLTEAEAERHPRRNEILRSVGVDTDVEPETRELELRAGDNVILCSDGLCGVLDDGEIYAVIASADEAKPRRRWRACEERGRSHRRRMDRACQCRGRPGQHHRAATARPESDRARK